MASQKEYEAVLALGARLQSSFGGAFGAAKRTLKSFGNAAKSVGKMFAPLWRGIQLGLGMLAAHAVTNIFQKIFGGAEEAAKAALKRTQQLTAALSSQPQLQKLGKNVIEGQVLALQKVSAELGKVGVVHSDHFEQASRTLALYGKSPAQIAKMLPVLADTLVATKGVNASVEEMENLTMGVVKAFQGGKVNLADYGILMDANQKKAFAALKPRQKEIELIKILTQKYTEANKAAASTDEGKIQIMHNQMAAFSETIGKTMIPMQAKMAEFWTAVLPSIEPLAKDVFQGIATAMGDTAAFAKDVVVPAIEMLAAYFKGEAFGGAVAKLGDAFNELGKALKPLTDAFGLTGTEAMSLGEIITGVLHVGLVGFTKTIELTALAVKALGDMWNRSFVKALIDGFGLVAALDWSKVGEAIMKPFSDAVKIIGDFPGQVTKALEPIQEALSKPFLLAIQTVLDAWNKLVSAIANFKMPDIGAGIKGAWDWATGGGKKAPGAQYGGIFRRPAVREIAEAGVPEAVIPLKNSARSRGLLGAAAAAIGPDAGGGSMMNRTSLNFNPQISIAGNADRETVTALDRSLRNLADDFLNRWNQAQEQERRLSFST